MKPPSTIFTNALSGYYYIHKSTKQLNSFIQIILEFQYYYTVEPPIKGQHIRDNINPALMSFVERLTSFKGSQCVNL